MEWYIPITILPAVGMLILSTANILIALNNEIRELNIEKEKFKLVIQQKILQLKKLNYALITQYLSSFMLVMAGVIGELSDSEKFIIYFVFIGVLMLAISITLLIEYSIKSLKIRQEHLKI